MADRGPSTGCNPFSAKVVEILKKEFPESYVPISECGPALRCANEGTDALDRSRKEKLSETVSKGLSNSEPLVVPLSSDQMEQPGLVVEVADYCTDSPPPVSERRTPHTSEEKSGGKDSKMEKGL